MHPSLTAVTPQRSAAYSQYHALIKWYRQHLPAVSFPWVPLTIAAAFQVLAWFGGRFLHGLTLVPRVAVLWLFALGEYSFMSPTMNAAVEVLRMPEPLLIVIYQVITLVVFIVLHVTLFRQPFRLQYAVSFVLLALAVYVAYLA